MPFFISLCHCRTKNKSGRIRSREILDDYAPNPGSSVSGTPLAEDFKTINGKVYKDATISRVEADGIMLRTKTGISKVYFVELPKDVQERFHYEPPKPVAAPREREPIKVEAKKDVSRHTDQGGWAAALLLSGVFLRVLVIGTLIITAVVIAIVCSRYL